MHTTTRAFLLDKPHVHFIGHHRHNDSQLLGTHLRAPNLSRNISLQRLAIRTSGAVNSRSTLPLTVHTTIEHLPATSTPNLKHLIQKGVDLCHSMKTEKGQRTETHPDSTSTKPLKKGASSKSVGFSFVHHRSSQWTRKSLQISNNHFHRNESCSPADTATRRHFPYSNKFRLTMRLSYKRQ